MVFLIAHNMLMYIVKSQEDDVWISHIFKHNSHSIPLILLQSIYLDFCSTKQNLVNTVYKI